jgi:hypothetical protein
MGQFDTGRLYQFLSQTPEKGLRQMLIDGKHFSEIHFNILLKVVRSSDEGSFGTHFEQGTFPKMRFNEKEEKLKEKFWKECTTCFSQRGLLSAAPPAKKVVPIAS